MAVSEKKSLQISVLRAEMLPNVDGFLAGKSDPYVLCHIPGKSKSTMQTPVIQDNLNPQWDHIDVVHDYAPGDSLEFQVWDKNNFPMPDTLIGKVKLGPEDFAANPYGMEGDLQLEDCKAQSATLTIQVHVLEGDLQAQEEAAHAAAAAQGEQPTVGVAQKFKLRVDLLNAKMLPNKEGELASEGYR
eukprot:TRINITY_DN4720_c0_g1_i2.p2 TRINITY_DN4720_c0_g1~~TRINITY_DN4720_c0_g1_i2.p2  ORF type:complete len:205 (+),score=48.68 TRINITY_DN4720_c0_g1_i2:57-617(+)